jgi:hypothetical protein
VDNQSSKILVFHYSHKYKNAKDSVTICPPHKITLIENVGMRGANPHDEKDEFLKPLDKLNLKTIDSELVAKNLYDRKNWTYSNKITRFGLLKTGSNNYVLRIKSADINP